MSVNIQWVNTEVCMDWSCPKDGCDGEGHLDVTSCCAVKCPACGQIYLLGAEVKLFPVEHAGFVFERVFCDEVEEVWKQVQA